MKKYRWLFAKTSNLVRKNFLKIYGFSHRLEVKQARFFLFSVCNNCAKYGRSQKLQKKNFSHRPEVKQARVFCFLFAKTSNNICTHLQFYPQENLPKRHWFRQFCVHTLKEICWFSHKRKFEVKRVFIVCGFRKLMKMYGFSYELPFLLAHTYRNIWFFARDFFIAQTSLTKYMVHRTNF